MNKTFRAPKSWFIPGERHAPLPFAGPCSRGWFPRLVLGAVLTGGISPLAMAGEPALKPIFNGRDLAGWSAGNEAPPTASNWRVENGILVGASNEKLLG